MAIFTFAPDISETLNGLHPSIPFFFQYLIQFVILFFPLWILVINKYSASLQDFAFRKIRFGFLLKTVILCYLFYLFVSLVIMSLLSYTGLELPGYEKQESYLPLFGVDTVGLIVGILMATLVAPFFEELFFRGFVYRIFTKTWPIWLGSVLTAILFAFIHFQFQSILPLFILGLVLNYSYQKTGSLWTAVAFHSLNNAIAFGLDFYLYFHPETLQKLEGITAFLYF